MKKETYFAEHNDYLVFPPAFLEGIKCEVLVDGEWEETEFFLKTDKIPDKVKKEDEHPFHGKSNVRFVCYIK